MRLDLDRTGVSRRTLVLLALATIAAVALGGWNAAARGQGRTPVRSDVCNDDHPRPIAAAAVSVRGDRVER